MLMSQGHAAFIDVGIHVLRKCAPHGDALTDTRLIGAVLDHALNNVDMEGIEAIMVVLGKWEDAGARMTTLSTSD
jgi:hypothetical protein